MKSRSAIPYLVLNILVSALTTLTVLLLWNAGRPQCAAGEVTPAILPTLTPTPPISAPVELPALDQAVVQIENVFGTGEVQNEVVLLRNVSANDLQLKDWQMVDEGGNLFTFPELILASQSAVQIYSRSGSNNPISLFWGLQDAAWTPGETVRILDPVGQERARYLIP